MVLLYIILAVVSLVIIIIAAEFFIDQATAISVKYRLSTFLVGFVIVSFATNIPEIVMSLYSVGLGHPCLAIGNVVGSNISNSTLVLGLAALVHEYKIKTVDLKLNIPVFFVVIVAVLALIAFNGFSIGPLIGSTTILIFFVSVWMLRSKLEVTFSPSKTQLKPLVLIVSVIAIGVFGKLCVDSLLIVSSELGIGEGILGYLFLAVGSSTPEIITLLAAGRKGEVAMGLGTILGSNLINLLVVLGLASYVSVLDLSGHIFGLAFFVLSTIFIVIFAYTGKKYYFCRKEGVALILLFVVFAVCQIFGFAT